MGPHRPARLRRHRPHAADRGVAPTRRGRARERYRGRDKAPLFQGEGLNGAVDLETMVGERLLVLFVHPTCPPCKEFFISLNGEPEHIEQQGARLVLVSGGSHEQNREMAEEFKLSCPLVIQQEHEIADLYGSSWTPYGFVVDADGKIAGKGVVNDVHVLGELLATDATAGSLPQTGSV